MLNAKFQDLLKFGDNGILVDTDLQKPAGRRFYEICEVGVLFEIKP
jgi:hypothetical protein